ncbi:hypothetical protein MBT84_12100 [Streptomyces sp. MBT84]|nr:hypothetical protein [Streptomyces sp. MBT84]
MSTCTTASRDLDEPLAGTAATARTWLLLEQPGPWGPKALTSSHLYPELGRALEAAADGTGVRIALIRRPGRHADCGTPAARQIYAAHTLPGNVWLQAATTSEPERLLDLDFAALGRGTPAPSTRSSGPNPIQAIRSRSSAPTASGTVAAPSSAAHWRPS